MLGIITSKYVGFHSLFFWDAAFVPGYLVPDVLVQCSGVVFQG